MRGSHAPTVAACRTGGHTQRGVATPQLTQSSVPPTPKEGAPANSHAMWRRNERFFFTFVLVNAVASSSLLVGSSPPASPPPGARVAQSSSANLLLRLHRLHG